MPKSLPKNPRIRRSISLDVESYTWLRERYEGVSIEWIINQLLQAYILVHKDSPDLFRNAAEKMAKQLDEIDLEE